MLLGVHPSSCQIADDALAVESATLEHVDLSIVVHGREMDLLLMVCPFRRLWFALFVTSLPNGR